MEVAQAKSAWILALVLLVWAVSATTAAVYYRSESLRYDGLYKDLADKLGEVSISVDLVIDYGNGTRDWHRSLVIPIGATLKNATLKVAVIETDPVYPGFVTSINGVRQNEVGGVYWLWWIWDDVKQEWGFGPVGFNEYTLRDKQTLIWHYAKEGSPAPP